MTDTTTKEAISLKEFFESTAPNVPVVQVRGIACDLSPAVGGKITVRLPNIDLHCTSEKCKSELRVFSPQALIYNVDESTFRNDFITYSCRSCEQQGVTIAFSWKLTHARSGTGWFMKLGQDPPFGEPLSPKLVKLIGPDRDLFLQGYRAENYGLGIGAYAYYRKVVENQKNRIIERIADVARRMGSSKETDNLFAAALKEHQFSTSVDKLRDFIPESLLIAGLNPLTLLHAALSRPLHDPNMTDDYCLERARAIRTILGDLASRAAQALKDDKAILDAVNLLRNG